MKPTNGNNTFLFVKPIPVAVLVPNDKCCKRCGEMKTIENFRFRPKSPKGFDDECNECASGWRVCSQCGARGKIHESYLSPLYMSGRPLLCKKCGDQRKLERGRRRSLPYQFSRNEARHSKAEWKTILDHYCPDGRCLCCGEKPDFMRSLQRDHIIPVTKGGHSGITNIQPLCPKCNIRKGNNIIDYRPDRGAFARNLAQTQNQL